MLFPGHRAIGSKTRPSVAQVGCATGTLRAKLIVALTAISLIVLGACASPARPTANAMAPSETRVGEPRVLNGEYVMTFHTRWFGTLKGRFAASPTDAGFQANTRPGVAWSMIGGVESTIGPLLAPYVFPQGMLLLWRSAAATPDKPGEGELGPTTVGMMSAKTVLPFEANSPAEVRFEGGKTIAVMTIEPSESGPLTGTDYVALAAKARGVLETHAFDPSVLKTKEAKEYFADLESAAKSAQDDVEFLLGSGLAWRKRENMPFPFVFRRADEAQREKLWANVKDGAQASKVTFDSASRVVTVEPLVFIDDANVDEMFTKAMQFGPAAMVIDLRSTPGADLWALRAAAWVVESPLRVGRYFGGGQREAALKKASTWSPGAVSGSDAAPMRRALDDSGGVDITVLPIADGFRGPVAVVTSSRTSGAAEVLTWALQREKRAIVIGETTAKRPLISRTYDLDETWQIRLATFDFIGPGGERIQKRGVRPDVRVARDGAAKRAVEELKKLLGRGAT